MIPASSKYLRLLISILEETTTVLDDTIIKMAGCDLDAIDLDPENVAMIQNSHFNLVSQIQSQLREYTLKSYADLFDHAVKETSSDRNKESK